MNTRSAIESDISDIYDLHQKVAQSSGGIARNVTEISLEYIYEIFSETKASGIMLVGIHPETNQIIAEMHATKYGLQLFNHILTNLTIVVHPDYQAQGFGKKIFQAFLKLIKENYPEIGRVELESRAKNLKSINLYTSLGFYQEGIMKNKTHNADGTFEDSILMAWFNPTYKF